MNEERNGGQSDTHLAMLSSFSLCPSLSGILKVSTLCDSFVSGAVRCDSEIKALGLKGTGSMWGGGESMVIRMHKPDMEDKTGAGTLSLLKWEGQLRGIDVENSYF